MKYKDYYSIFGVDRNAATAEIKAAYRKLAHKFHPDVSKEADAEEKFKEISEAYKTLKDPEKRAAYDQLGRYQSGQDFKPPPDWQKRYSDAAFSVDDLDLSDLFASLRGGRYRPGRAGHKMPTPGQDYEVTVHITLEEAYRGPEVELELNMPEYDENGFPHRIPHKFKTRIPKGATDGQRLRVPGKGGKGVNGGANGDLYLNIVLRPHLLYRPSGYDLYLDLPLAPWEAVLGALVELPTPGGSVRLKIPSGTHAGQQLRLPKRGLPTPDGGQGDLFAIVQIVVPRIISDREHGLYQRLAERSAFNPRGHFEQGMCNER